MNSPPLDSIHIRDLRARCILGIFPEEREKTQEIILNITLFADLRAACQSDDIRDTVDYKKIKKAVLAMVEASSFYLVEGLAEAVAQLCLTTPEVKAVKVIIDKTGALRFARSVAVEIMRSREDV
jgi:D-erythro-7,8-dihydroneopterin triphosphate epimerase